MKISNFDYNNYDKIDVYAKKFKTETIVSCYESFGWKLVNISDNDKYEDLNDITFVRPHKIPNKDFLQYNQIEMENILNKMGKLEKNKHSVTTIVGLCLGLFAMSMAILAIYFFRLGTISNNIYGIICSVLCVLGCCAEGTATLKVSKKESLRYSQKYTELETELNNICNIVREKVNEQSR